MWLRCLSVLFRASFPKLVSGFGQHLVFGHRAVCAFNFCWSYISYNIHKAYVYKRTKFLDFSLEFNSIHSVQYSCNHWYVSTYGHNKILGYDEHNRPIYFRDESLSSRLRLYKGIRNTHTSILHCSAKNVRKQL